MRAGRKGAGGHGKEGVTVPCERQAPQQASTSPREVGASWAGGRPQRFSIFLVSKMGGGATLLL